MGGHPTRAVLGQGPSGHQAVEVDVGLEGLIPGMQEHGRTELAAQVLLATLEERLTDGAAQQGEQETFGVQDEGIEGVRHGKHGGDIGGR